MIGPCWGSIQILWPSRTALTSPSAARATNEALLRSIPARLRRVLKLLNWTVLDPGRRQSSDPGISLGPHHLRRRPVTRREGPAGTDTLMTLIAMFLLPGWVLGCASTAPSRGDPVPNPVVPGRLYDLSSSDLLNAGFASDPASAGEFVVSLSDGRVLVGHYQAFADKPPPGGARSSGSGPASTIPTRASTGCWRVSPPRPIRSTGSSAST